MQNPSTSPFQDLEALNSTIEAVRADPDLGHVTFSVMSSSAGGLKADSVTGALTQAGRADESRHGKFTFSSDEPMALLGSDTAVSPAEYILKGLAGCYMVTLASLAAKRRINLSHVDINLYFDIDLNGFLGIDKNVRKGAKSIRVDVHIDSPGTARSSIDELIRDLENASPIRDTLANEVNVITTLAT